jgi:hypothetical protein
MSSCHFETKVDLEFLGVTVKNSLTLEYAGDERKY